jgi:hypothetical protein
VVVDSATFNALKQSNELGTLANQDKGLPNFLPVDDSATTIYMRFKSTYLEIMDLRIDSKKNWIYRNRIFMGYF